MSSSRRGRSYGRPGGPSGDKTLVLCLVGGVVFVLALGIFIVVGTNRSDHRPERRLVDGGRTSKPVFRRLEAPDEESTRPPVSRSREDQEPEEEPPPPEPEPIEEESPPPPAEPAVATPETRPPEKVPVRQPVKKPPPEEAAGPGSVCKMLLTGKLGSESLSSSDSRAWSRIGYFLQHEAPSQHWLEFPDGKVKVIRRPGEKKKSGAKFPDGYPSAAARKKPGHRLVIHATSTFDGDIEFNGVKTGSRYSCRLDCSLEESAGSGFKSIGSFSIQEKITPAVVTAEEDGDPAQLRMAFYAALEKLCLELSEKSPFSS